MELDFTKPNKKGRKPKLYLVLDCETATLPFVRDMNLTAEEKQKISIAKPLIYDIGWKIIDRKGNVYAEHSYLVQETFFVPNVFNTAYYRDKRPIYMERYENKEIIAKNWKDIAEILLEECKQVDFVTAYNAMFDFKKAIPYTENYIEALYSNNYQKWEDTQKKVCENILRNGQSSNPNFDGMNFNFRNENFPMADIWGIACNELINKDKYKTECIKQGILTKSGIYFKSSAETVFQYILNDWDFVEEHTAIKDVEIECDILLKALKKKNISQGIEYFPFKELGEVDDFIISAKKKKGKPVFTAEEVDNVIDIMYQKSLEYQKESAFVSKLDNKIMRLERWKNENLNTIRKDMFSKSYVRQLETKAKQIENYMRNLAKGGTAYNERLAQLERIDEQICKYADYAYKKN